MARRWKALVFAAIAGAALIATAATACSPPETISSPDASDPERLSFRALIDRSALVECIANAPGTRPLLGQVELELVDLLVDCTNQRLVSRPESPYLPLVPLLGEP